MFCIYIAISDIVLQTVFKVNKSEHSIVDVLIVDLISSNKYATINFEVGRAPY